MALALALDARAPTDLHARSYAIRVRVADERLTIPIKSSLGNVTLAGPAKSSLGQVTRAGPAR
jgi:hypothetical protein